MRKKKIPLDIEQAVRVSTPPRRLCSMIDGGVERTQFDLSRWLARELYKRVRAVLTFVM
jgi:hypothetical protein